MSSAPWTETSHITAAVTITHVHCCLTAAGHFYVMLGTIKSVDKSVNDNSARRFDHSDIIASRSGFGVATGVPHSEVELQTKFKSFTAAHLGSNTNQHTDWTLGGTCIKSSRSVYAPHLVQSVRLHSFKYRGDDNAHWISKNKMAATAVQLELCGTNFRENIANLWVLCCNGNNDRSAPVLFVQHPQEQGEWLRQKPRYAWVLTASFALLPRVLDEQHPRSLVSHYPLNKPFPDSKLTQIIVTYRITRPQWVNQRSFMITCIIKTLVFEWHQENIWIKVTENPRNFQNTTNLVQSVLCLQML